MIACEEVTAAVVQVAMVQEAEMDMSGLSQVFRALFTVCS
jgi:hypothetical protein